MRSAYTVHQVIIIWSDDGLKGPWNWLTCCCLQSGGSHQALKKLRIEETENAHVTFVTPVSFLSMQKLLLEVVHTQIKLTTPSNTSKQLRVKKRVVYCK